MTRPDRNEIERMLASGEPPKPPAGLLEKLHSDIPETLDVSGVDDARRATGSWRRGWVAAASVLAVVSMSYVMMRVVETPEYQSEVSVAEQRPVITGASRSDTQSPALELESVSGNDADSARPAAPYAPELSKDLPRTQATSGDALPMATSAISQAVESREEAYREEPEPERVIAAAPAPAVLAAPPPPPAEGRIGGITRDSADEGMLGERAARNMAAQATPAPGARDRQAKAVARPSPARGTSSGALIDTEADPVSTFGLRVPDSSWALVRGFLRNGQLPPSESVRPEELINYFRYSDPAPSRGEVTLRTEGAESPLRADGSEHLLRVGIRVSSDADLSVLGAKMQVEFVPAAVDAYRLLGFEQEQRTSLAMPAGDDLPPGHRVTALYEVRVGPEVAASAQVGAVRLEYENARGEKKQMEHVVRKSELGKAWGTASEDLQLAALVGDWAALLQRGGTSLEAEALVRRAKAVAGLWRGDDRVVELAALIRATARLLR